MFYVSDYKVETNITTESWKKFIKKSIDHDVLKTIDQGIFRFDAKFIHNYKVAENPEQLAIWNWMGTLRLVDYSHPDAYSRKSGDWPIVTQVNYSKELENTIVVFTEEEPKDYELGDGVRKALEVSEEDREKSIEARRRRVAKELSEEE